MDPLNIDVNVKGIAINDATLVKNFLDQLEACLGQTGFIANKTYCQVTHQGEFIDLPYAQRAQWGQYDGSLNLCYKNIRKYVHDICFVGNQENGLILSFNLKTHFPPFFESYTRRQIEEAYLLQSLGRDLYAKLPAESVVATTYYQETFGGRPWFKFSKEEYIELGTLPIDEKREKWLEEHPEEHD